MNNLLWIFIGVAVLGGGLLFAQSKITKTDDGFIFDSAKVHTWYESRIIWGGIYTDHEGGGAVHNTEVVAFGDGWEYSTTTDDNGNFKVEVKADSAFKIKASDGNQWATSEELDGVQLGTTKVDKK